MAEIIGLGFQVQDRWGNKGKNVFHLPDKSATNPFTGEPVYYMADEWVAAGNGSLDDFWGMREARLNEHAQEVFQNSLRKGGLPMDVFGKFVHTSSAPAVQQVLSAMPSWDSFMDIVNSGNGKMYGIDIETFGDISNGNGVFGITEIGINEVTIDRHTRTHNAVSIALGINDKQKRYLEDLVGKFEHNGWNTLDGTEQSTLLRMSKYGGRFEDRFAEGVAKNTPIGGKWFSTVESLLPDNIDAAEMRKGIENLHKLQKTYRHTDPKDVMQSVMQFFEKKSDSLFYAANSNFDFNGLKRVAEINGIAVPDTYADTASKALDVTYIVRAAAAADGQSVSSWGNSIYNRGGGADMENLLRMFRIPGQQEHLGASDLVNEMEVLFREESNIYKVYGTAIQDSFASSFKELDPEHTLYYIRRGQFNKVNADDFAYVPDEASPNGYRAVANYAITEEFWRVDTEHSGIVTLDGKEKFSLVMSNEADRLADEEPTKIVLTGDTAADVQRRLEYMANPVAESALKEKDILFQQEFHYRDMGRREFDRMFNSADIRIDNKKEINGFVSLKKNLDIEQIVSDWEKENGVLKDGGSKTARKIYDIVTSHTDALAKKDVEERIKSGALKFEGTADEIAKAKELELKATRKKMALFNSDYDAQAFTGLRPMLHNKMELLQSIAERVDKDPNTSGLSNTDKTIVARDAFDKAISKMHELYDYGNPNKKKEKAFSDLMDIDISVNNGNDIRRINGYSQKTIAEGLNKYFISATPEDIEYSLGILQKRGLIENTQKYIEQLKGADVNTRKSYENSMYFLAQDIAYELDKTDFSNGKRRMQSVVTNIKDYDDMRFKVIGPGNTEYTFPTAYGKVKDSIDDVITGAINSAPKTTYNEGRFITDDQIKILMNSLNINDGSEEQYAAKKKLFKEMFEGGDNNKAYAIKDRKDIQSFIVNNESGSSYLFLTRNSDSQRLYEKLVSDVYDYSSYGKLRRSIEENGGYLGSVVELPRLNKYKLGNGKSMVTVRQGPESEKFLLPELRTFIGENGKMQAYFNDADYSMFTLWRRMGEGILDETAIGNYDSASRTGRKMFNEHIKDMPSSSSYRRIGDTRKINFGPSDRIHSEEMRIMDGLKAIFNFMVGKDVDTVANMNAAQRIVYEFGMNEGINPWMIKKIRENKMSWNTYLNSVVSGDTFDQFISSRMLIGKMTNVPSLSNLKVDGADGTVLEFIRNEVFNHGDQYGFHDSVKTAFSHIPYASQLSPIGVESAIEKGSVFTALPGEYVQHGGLVSTMRPTYTQQNNAIAYDLDDAIKGITEADGSFGGFLKGFSKDVISYGRNSLESREFKDRVALASQGIEMQERNFMAKVKYMSEYELQTKVGDFTKKSKNKAFRNQMMSEYGMSEEQFFKIAEIFQSDLFSMHEDKTYIAPGLKETDLFQSRESMRYTVDVSNLNRPKTLAALKKLKGKTLTHDTVLFTKNNGQALYYTGPEAIFSEINYESILDAFDNFKHGDDTPVDIFLQLTKGSIVDDKMMFNGSEKSTVHSISMDAVNKVLGNNPKALEIANRMFNFLSDGALVIMNPKSAKHGALHSALSDWNVIVDKYAEAGKTDSLARYLNNLIDTDKKKTFTGGLGYFDSVNNRLVGSTALGEHNAVLIERMVKDIRSNRGVGLNSDVNKTIVNTIDELARLNQQYSLTQRQGMTEFLGKVYVMDQRTEQSMRTRGMKYSFEGGNGILDSNARIVDDLRQYSQNYTGKGSSLSEAGFSNLQNLADTMSIAKNHDKIKHVTAHRDMERSVKGIVEVVNAFNNEPVTSKNLAGRNIVEFNINDMVKSIFWNEGGVTTDELKSSFFFIDGRPSKLLQQKAEEQGINLFRDSYSIFINMNKEFTIGDKGKTTDGLLIPIQNVSSLSNDRHYFQSQQAYTTRLFNNILNRMKNPARYKDDGVTISSLYADYVQNKLKGELDFMNKDTDFTKALQQYAVPTSQYFLGQDEAAPLLKSNMNRLGKLAEERNSIERRLIKDPTNENIIQQYRNALEAFNQEIESVASEVEAGTAKFSQYAALANKANKKMGEALKVIDANGKMHHGMGIALSKEGLENQGIVFSNVAMDLVADMEMMESGYKGQFEKIAKFKKEHFGQVAELKQRLDGLVVNQDVTLQIDQSRPLMAQLDEQLGISIKDLNDSITSGNKQIGVSRIVNLFETSRIAQDYLSEVGTLGNINRSPVFRAQPVARFLLDESLRGNQMRTLDAVTSMLTNLDFDGDTLAGILRLNGSSILKATSQQFQDYLSEYTRFSLENHSSMLADLIRDSSSYRVEHAASHRYQQAMLLKIDNEEAYNKGIQKFLENHDIKFKGQRITDLSALDDLTKDAVKYAADNSNEMAEMFEQTLGNTLKNENMQLATYAAKKRKEYIGAVSTPAYRIRSTILDVMDNESITAEQRAYLNDVFVNFNNMLSERGGFTAISEQKGIDTKFAKDAAKFSRLTQWAGAMTDIIKGDKDFILGDNVYKIIEAIGPNVYGISTPEQFKEYAEIARYVPDEQFKQAYLTGGAIPTRNNGNIELDRDTIQELWGLHSFIEATHKIPQLSKTYNEIYAKDKTTDFILSINSRSDIDQLKTQTRNTPARMAVDVSVQVNSGFDSPYVKDKVYFKTGTLFDDFDKTEYFISEGANNFRKIESPNYSSSKDFKDFVPGKEIEYHSNQYFAGQKGFNFSDIRNGMNNESNNLQDAIVTERIANTLDRLTLRRDKKTGELVVRTFQDKQFNQMFRDRYDPAIQRNVAPHDNLTGQQTIEWLHSMFARGNNANEVGEFMATYDKAIAMGHTDEYSSGADLIKALNRKIAEEGWKDLSGGGKPVDDYYNVLLRPHVIDALGGLANYHRYHDLAVNMPNFDNEKYLNAIDSLDGKLYDIGSIEKDIGQQFDRVLTERQHWKDLGKSDADLSAFDSFINQGRSKYTQSKINSLQQGNANIISQAQSQVYDMFENNGQISRHFGWDGGIEKQNQMVGFGEYMGKEFKDLSSSDIENIMNASFDDYSKGLSSGEASKLRYAMDKTKKALEGFESMTIKDSAISRAAIPPEMDEVVKKTSDEITELLNKAIEGLGESTTGSAASEAASEAATEAGQQAAQAAKDIEKRTLRGDFFENAKQMIGDLGITKKTVGVVAGALAALGIINNVIHNDKPQSPLTPARTSNNNNDPYLKNNETQYQAPPSPKETKTVYHHNGSGLNFKVSAKTKRSLDDQSKAKLIGMAGGGQPSIHTYADNSGITNNWLENKFAQLMN